MQLQCPQCSQKITLDDAKVPERPFNLKCPKCQNVIKLPGRSAMAADGGTSTASPEMPPAAVVETTPPNAPEPQSSSPGQAHLRRVSNAHFGGLRALIALPDQAHARAAMTMLMRLGLACDTLDDMDEAARLLERGHYHLVATVSGPAGKEGLDQRINRLSPEARRQIFLVLVSDNYTSGDGTEAFARLADLLLKPGDIANADRLLGDALEERIRLYKVFLETIERFEAAG